MPRSGKPFHAGTMITNRKTSSLSRRIVCFCAVFVFCASHAVASAQVAIVKPFDDSVINRIRVFCWATFSRMSLRFNDEAIVNHEGHAVPLRDVIAPKFFPAFHHNPLLATIWSALASSDELRIAESKEAQIKDGTTVLITPTGRRVQIVFQAHAATVAALEEAGSLFFRRVFPSYLAASDWGADRGETFDLDETSLSIANSPDGAVLRIAIELSLLKETQVFFLQSFLTKASAKERIDAENQDLAYRGLAGLFYHTYALTSIAGGELEPYRLHMNGLISSVEFLRDVFGRAFPVNQARMIRALKSIIATLEAEAFRNEPTLMPSAETYFKHAHYLVEALASMRFSTEQDFDQDMRVLQRRIQEALRLD